MVVSYDLMISFSYRSISEENLANERLQNRHIRAQVISFDSEGSFSPSLTNNDVIIKRSVPGRIPTEKGQAGRNSKVLNSLFLLPHFSKLK